MYWPFCNGIMGLCAILLARYLVPLRTNSCHLSLAAGHQHTCSSSSLIVSIPAVSLQERRHGGWLSSNFHCLLSSRTSSFGNRQWPRAGECQGESSTSSEDTMADGKLRRLSKDAAPLQKPNGPNLCTSRTDF